MRHMTNQEFKCLTSTGVGNFPRSAGVVPGRQKLSDYLTLVITLRYPPRKPRTDTRHVHSQGHSTDNSLCHFLRSVCLSLLIRLYLSLSPFLPISHPCPHYHNQARVARTVCGLNYCSIYHCCSNMP